VIAAGSYITPEKTKDIGSSEKMNTTVSG